MLLNLIIKFNSEHPEELNFFNEAETLECLSVEVISIRLFKRFEIDIERVRKIVNKDSLSQSDLVSLAHFAIDIANGTTNTSHTAKSKKQDKNDDSAAGIFFTWSIRIM